MSRRFLLALLLALAAALPATAHAWTWGDTLTVIMKPLPNIPSFARPGDTLTVWARAPIGASAWSASLLHGGDEHLLVPRGGDWQPSLDRWVLYFQVPPAVMDGEGTIPTEIYDLVLLSSATAPDTARHAVQVMGDYPGDFYFAQVSDTHLPMHPFSSDGGFNVNDTTAMADFSAVIEDLNLIRPKFVLHTGDLVNEGELEEYLGVYEMSRANEMFSRLRDPIFVVSGNHDIGGWKPTPPPDGTARKNWWRQFGWPWLLNPPPGDLNHSQNYSFDYGALHVIGLETYINNGNYDSYRTDLWGAQSFTAEQLAWLANDIAAAPAGSSTLAFYHFDFGGTNPNGTPCTQASCKQINPATLGLDGAIYGHNHGIAEGNRSAVPFNLGLRAVVDGRRTFRIFRVSNGVIMPGPMHQSGGTAGIPVDSLSALWNGPNDGTRSLLTASVNNRFGESWDHSRLVFHMADNDSSFLAIGGTVAQVVRSGDVARVYVDCSYPASSVTAVTVSADRPNVGVGDAPAGAIALAPPSPNPLVRGEARFRFTLAARGPARLAVHDISGRRVATLVDGETAAGTHEARWNGRDASGAAAASGVYIVSLSAGGRVVTRRLTLFH